MKEVATINKMEQLRHAADEIKSEFLAANPNLNTKREPDAAVLMSSSSHPDISPSNPALFIEQIPAPKLEELNQIVAKVLGKHKIPEVWVEMRVLDENQRSKTLPLYKVSAE